LKKSPKNAAERKKQKQRTEDAGRGAPQVKTENAQTTPDYAHAKVKTEHSAKTEGAQTTPDFARAKVKTEKTPTTSPSAKRRKDLPVQKNSMFRYVVKSAK
jgi:hypothetical protein